MSRQVTSDKNYMKRNPASTHTTMLGPDTLRFGGSWYTRDKVIPHTVKKPPLVRVFYEPFGDGKLYEAIQDSQNFLTNPPNTYGGTQDGPTLMVSFDADNLYLRMFFPNNTKAAVSYPIYYVIYWDYGMT